MTIRLKKLSEGYTTECGRFSVQPTRSGSWSVADDQRTVGGQEEFFATLRGAREYIEARLAAPDGASAEALSVATRAIIDAAILLYARPMVVRPIGGRAACSVDWTTRRVRLCNGANVLAVYVFTVALDGGLSFRRDISDGAKWPPTESRAEAEARTGVDVEAIKAIPLRGSGLGGGGRGDGV